MYFNNKMTELGLNHRQWYRYDFYNGGGTLIHIYKATPRAIRYSEYTYEETTNPHILALGCELTITEHVGFKHHRVNRKDGDDFQIEVIGDFGTPRIITLDNYHRLHTSNESDFALKIYNPFKHPDHRVVQL